VAPRASVEIIGQDNHHAQGPDRGPQSYTEQETCLDVAVVASGAGRVAHDEDVAGPEHVSAFLPRILCRDLCERCMRDKPALDERTLSSGTRVSLCGRVCSPVSTAA
jgi:hypothetical protein